MKKNILAIFVLLFNSSFLLAKGGIQDTLAGRPTEIEVLWKTTGENDWDIVPTVLRLHDEIQNRFETKINSILPSQLSKGLSITGWFEFDENEGNFNKMAVEYTAKTYDISLSNFLKKIPAHDWGYYLSGIIGRGISERKYDKEDRIDKKVVRQVERMILKGNLLIPIMPMTKVEVIDYQDDQVTVYWQVKDSSNNTTKADIGSIEFKEVGENLTQVTFRSAHRLRVNMGIASVELHPCLTHKYIGKTFLKHLNNYEKVIKTRD